MIKVNLIGESRRKSSRPAALFNVAMRKSAMPLVFTLVVAGTAFAGYLWYLSLSGSLTRLDTEIASAQARKTNLQAVIKQDQVYETRKKILETRIKIVEGLRRHQVNPVLAMDVLSAALEQTQYVWLSSLDQRDATLSMSGTGTSLNAIADFVSNLERSGYFRNSDLANATDSAGNFVFSLKCEFAPPGTHAAASGGN